MAGGEGGQVVQDGFMQTLSNRWLRWRPERWNRENLMEEIALCLQQSMLERCSAPGLATPLRAERHATPLHLTAASEDSGILGRLI